MTARQLRVSRQSIIIAAALTGVLSLAIGAHAALNRGVLDAGKVIAAENDGNAAKKTSRIALVIGNDHYPDADAPLTQSINDARDLTASLRSNGFNVDILEDITARTACIAPLIV
jgi:Caspase domain